MSPARNLEPYGRTDGAGRLPGNLQALRHGANSEAILSVRMKDILVATAAECPWILQSDEPAILQYCRAEAKARLLDDYIWRLIEPRVGEEDLPPDLARIPPYIWSESSKADLAAMRAGDRLGLSPEGRLKMAKDAGFAAHFGQQKLNGLVDTGKELMEARGK